MKLFGKKKSKVSSETNKAEESQQEVSSYFSQNQPKKGKKSSHAGNPDIEKLLAMDPSTLNSKQKRILRRHHEREGLNQDEETVQEKKETEQPQSSTNDDASTEPSNSTQSQHIEKIEIKTPSNESEESSLKVNIAEIEKKLHGMNSKERRKFLRELASHDSEHSKMMLAKAQEIAKKIAEENEIKHTTSKENTNQTVQLNEEQSKKNDLVTMTAENPTSTKKRKRKLADFSDLPPEERERREKQRQMQQEARIRRENGEEDLSRHPLNSERRRANKRKPGKTGKIARYIKEKKQKQQALNEYNAGGYYIRHQKKAK